MNPVLYPWLAQVGLITYRSMQGQSFAVTWKGLYPTVTNNKTSKRPPLPSELLSTFIIFGAYSVIGAGGGERPRIAALLGWGTVLATFMLVAQGSQSSSPAVNTPSTPSTAPAGGKVMPA